MEKGTPRSLSIPASPDATLQKPIACLLDLVALHTVVGLLGGANQTVQFKRRTVGVEHQLCCGVHPQKIILARMRIAIREFKPVVAWNPIGDVVVFKHHDHRSVFFTIPTPPFHIEVVRAKNILLNGPATPNGQADQEKE